MIKRQRRGFFALVHINLKLVGLGVLGLVLGAGAVMAAAATGEGVGIPVVMYHALLKDEARHGRYVISPAEFESDLKYLRDNGYTTILPQDLVAYTKGGQLPEKPVLLTFDDGYYNNYLYAYPLAKEYNSKFLLSPIGHYADLYTDTPDENAYYSHATWPQLREMVESGLVEVGNHSYDLHQSQGNRLGIRKRQGEPEEAYKQLVTEDLLQAQQAIKEGVGLRPITFVYPFGAVSKSTPDIVKGLGFQCTFSCEEHISKVTRDPASLYDLGRFLRKSGVSSQQFFEGAMGLSPQC